jgi:tRNA(Ile)-lysidine synthase
MTPVRETVLRSIRERFLMRAGDRVGVAVSGGADSVALLRALLELQSELGIVLAIAHFNHGLRGEQSMADEAFVADLAEQHALELFVHRADIREHALSSKLSLEAAGRAARYRWFAQLAEQQRLNQIATAHTLDDQAETVLLKFLRGAGTRGLAGIYPIINRNGFRIVRPLLSVPRAEVESYLSSLGQQWREDESNLDHRFLRNRVRHQLLPLLERDYNPRLRHLLSDLAKLSQGEQHYWDELVTQHLTTNDAGELLLDGFAELPVAVQRRVVKRFAEAEGHALDFAHVEKLRRCALGERRKAELPGDRLAVRANGTLQIRSLR